MKQLRFFAAKDDLLPVLEGVEKNLPLQYVPIEGDGHSVEPIATCGDLPSIGCATNESAVNSDSFLVAARSTLIRPRPISLNGGALRYQIDQLENPDTVLLTPGGVWNGEIVLYGTVGTASDAEASRALLKIFETEFKKHFTKVKAYWVGPKALMMLREGKRLTIAAQSPRDFDLTA